MTIGPEPLGVPVVSYTAELEQGVHNALKAHDVKAAVDILEVLVRVDMSRGIKLYEEMKEALVIAKWLRS